jgi:hypothetical protein
VETLKDIKEAKKTYDKAQEKYLNAMLKWNSLAKSKETPNLTEVPNY